MTATMTTAELLAPERFQAAIAAGAKAHPADLHGASTFRCSATDKILPIGELAGWIYLPSDGPDTLCGVVSTQAMVANGGA